MTEARWNAEPKGLVIYQLKLNPWRMLAGWLLICLGLRRWGELVIFPAYSISHEVVR